MFLNHREANKVQRRIVSKGLGAELSNDKGPLWGPLLGVGNPAATYSPTQLLTQYHWR
jgi:hypothetical protein